MLIDEQWLNDNSEAIITIITYLYIAHLVILYIVGTYSLVVVAIDGIFLILSLRSLKRNHHNLLTKRAFNGFIYPLLGFTISIYSIWMI